MPSRWPTGCRRGASRPPGVVHCDLHPDNVMLTADGPVLIDSTRSGIGDRRMDLAHTWLIVAELGLPPTAWAAPVTPRPAGHCSPRSSEGSTGRGPRWLGRIAADRITDKNTTDEERHRLARDLTEGTSVDPQAIVRARNPGTRSAPTGCVEGETSPPGKCVSGPDREHHSPGYFLGNGPKRPKKCVSEGRLRTLTPPSTREGQLHGRLVSSAAARTIRPVASTKSTSSGGARPWVAAGRTICSVTVPALEGTPRG